MTKAGARAPASALSKTRPPAAAAKVRPQAPAAQAALAPKPPAAPMHNVLRLSTDDVAAVASNGTAGQKANQAANREAAPAGDTEQKLRNVQAKLMALDADASGLTPPLRPEASAGLPLAQQLDQTEQKIKEVRAKILALQVETKNMSSKEPAVIPAVKAKPVPAIATAAPPPPSSDNWLLIGLGGLLAASIAVIIAMMLRMRQLGKYTEHLGPY